jgi:hypothetical protein
VKINEKGRGATGSIEIEEEIGLTRLLLRRLLAILLGISDATPYLALVFRAGTLESSSITIRQNLRLQFRAEFFNAFNNVNFDNPAGILDLDALDLARSNPQ